MDLNTATTAITPSNSMDDAIPHKPKSNQTTRTRMKQKKPHIDLSQLQKLANARQHDSQQWEKRKTSRWNAELLSSPLRRQSQQQQQMTKKENRHNRTTTTALLMDDANDVPTTFTKENHYDFQQVLQKLESYNRTLTRTVNLSNKKNEKKITTTTFENKDPYEIVRKFENYKRIKQSSPQNEQQQPSSRNLLKAYRTQHGRTRSSSLLGDVDKKDLLTEMSVLARRHSSPIDTYYATSNQDDKDTPMSSSNFGSSTPTKNPFFSKRHDDHKEPQQAQAFSSPPGSTPSDLSISMIPHISSTTASLENKKQQPQSFTKPQHQKPSFSWLSWWKKQQNTNQNENNTNTPNNKDTTHSPHPTPLTVQVSSPPPSSQEFYQHYHHHHQVVDSNINDNNYLLQLSQLMFGYDHDVVRRYQEEREQHENDLNDLVHVLEKTIIAEASTSSTVSSLEDIKYTTTAGSQSRRQGQQQRRRTCISLLLFILSNSIFFYLLQHDQIGTVSPLVTNYTIRKTNMIQTYYNNHVGNRASQTKKCNKILTRLSKLILDSTKIPTRIQWQFVHHKVLSLVLPHTRYLYRYFYIVIDEGLDHDHVENINQNNNNNRNKEQETEEESFTSLDYFILKENDHIVQDKKDTIPSKQQRNNMMNEQILKVDNNDSQESLTETIKAPQEIYASLDNDQVEETKLPSTSLKEYHHQHDETILEEESTPPKIMKTAQQQSVFVGDNDDDYSVSTKAVMAYPSSTLQLKEDDKDQESLSIDHGGAPPLLPPPIETTIVETTAVKNMNCSSLEKDVTRTTTASLSTIKHIATSPTFKLEEQQEEEQEIEDTTTKGDIHRNDLKVEPAHTTREMIEELKGDDINLEDVHSNALRKSREVKDSSSPRAKEISKHSQGPVSTQTSADDMMADVKENETNAFVEANESSLQEERVEDINKRQARGELEETAAESAPIAVKQSLQQLSNQRVKNRPIRVIRPISIDEQSYIKAEKPFSMASLTRFSTSLKSDLMVAIQERLNHIEKKILSGFTKPTTSSMSTRTVAQRYEVPYAPFPKQGSRPLAHFVSISRNLQINTTTRRSGDDHLVLRYMQLIAFQLACFHADMNPNMTASVGGVYCKSIFVGCKQRRRDVHRPKYVASMVHWTDTEDIMHSSRKDNNDDQDAFLQKPLIEIVGDWFKERRRKRQKKKQMKKQSSRQRKQR